MIYSSYTTDHALRKIRLIRHRIYCLIWGFRKENILFIQEVCTPGKISFVWLRLLKNFLRNGWMDTSLYWQDVMPGRPRNFIRSSVNHRSNMILYRLDMCQTGTYGHCCFVPMYCAICIFVNGLVFSFLMHFTLAYLS